MRKTVGIRSHPSPRQGEVTLWELPHHQWLWGWKLSRSVESVECRIGAGGCRCFFKCVGHLCAAHFSLDGGVVTVCGADYSTTLCARGGCAIHSLESSLAWWCVADSTCSAPQRCRASSKTQPTYKNESEWWLL